MAGRFIGILLHTARATRMHPLFYFVVAIFGVCGYTFGYALAKVDAVEGETWGMLRLALRSAS